MNQKAFLGLRVATTLSAIVVIGLWFRQDADSGSMLFFGILTPLWFLPTLPMTIKSAKEAHAPILRMAIFAMMDVYLIVSLLAEAGASAVPAVSAFGLYTMLATAFTGPVVGGIAVIAGFFACLNSLFIPVGFDQRYILAAVFAGGAALVCGLAWRFSAPVMWHAAKQHASASAADKTSAPETSEDNEALIKKLDELQRRLQQVSLERDKAQEQLDGKDDDDLGNLALGSDPTDLTEDEPDEEESVQVVLLEKRVSGLEQSLEEAKIALTSSELEKNNMTRELEELSKELESAYGQGAVAETT